MNKSKDAKVITHPAPVGEPLSDDWSVAGGGAPMPVYCCRVSAAPLNQVWPGYQRPLDQTEPAAFAYCDAAGPLSVQVTSRREIESVLVRPLSRNITPAVKDRHHIDFEVPGPGHLTVEVNGWHNALHLFINPPEQAAPSAAGPNIRYFGPGVHRPGRIVMESDQTVYVAGGAVVYGSIHAKRAANIRILGRGIVDASEFERGRAGGAIRLEDCTDITIAGLVLRDPDVWCCSLFGCRNAELSNLKLVGLWRYNADGIDLCNSQDIRVRDCFVRAFDDCIVLKGLKWDVDKKGASYHERPVRGILVERCVVWNDWGRALEIGAETSAPEIADIVFRDCDIIRTAHIAMDIQHGDRAVVHGIRFENIRVEGDDFNLRPRMQQTRDEKYVVNPTDDYRPHLFCIIIRPNPYSRDRQLGVVREIVFKDIAATGRLFPPSDFRGADAEHNVAGVTIDNLKVNGRQCTGPEDAQIKIHPHVSDVTFK